MHGREDQLLDIGELVDGRFEIRSVLGQGGFGVVFKARQLSTGQDVAIKVLHAKRIRDAAKVRQLEERFLREMRVIGQLNHPNIVRLFDTGKLPSGALYAAIEFIEGETLAQVLAREGQLQAQEAIRVMGQVLDALACAHDAGIVHRDLKPENIMMTTTGARRNALVLDFGIAGVTAGTEGDSYEKLTKTGQFIGTPQYMAPEQLSNSKTTVQSDLYAWGLVFLEALCGVTIVNAGSVAAIMMKQCSDTPISIHPSISNSPLGRVLTKSVEKALDRRYRSAREALTVLDEAATQSFAYRITLLGNEPPQFAETSNLDEGEVARQDSGGDENWTEEQEGATRPMVSLPDSFWSEPSAAREGGPNSRQGLPGTDLASGEQGGDSTNQSDALSDTQPAQQISSVSSERPVATTSTMFGDWVSPEQRNRRILVVLVFLGLGVAGFLLAHSIFSKASEDLASGEETTEELPDVTESVAAADPSSALVDVESLAGLQDVVPVSTTSEETAPDPVADAQVVLESSLSRARQARSAQQVDVARLAYEQALKADPSSSEAQEGTAWGALERQDYALALRLYQALEGDLATRPSTALGKARASRGLGDLEATRGLYKALIKGFPKSAEAKVAKSELRALRGESRPPTNGTTVLADEPKQENVEIEPEKSKGLALDPAL